MPDSMYGVRGQSLMSMSESEKFTIKLGDQERERGEGKITYPRMHDHADLLLGSKEVRRR